MSDEPGSSGEIARYPRQPGDGRHDPRARPRAVQVALLGAGALAAVGLVAAAGLGVLYAFNPMGDEWVCSEGEAPAGERGRYTMCYPQGAKLPPGVSWDPFGNRPMPSNCDKDGWVPVERTLHRQGVPETEEDCVREGTDLPGRWRFSTETAEMPSSAGRSNPSTWA
jgi:hypothetical protein